MKLKRLLLISLVLVLAITGIYFAVNFISNLIAPPTEQINVDLGAYTYSVEGYDGKGDLNIEFPQFTDSNPELQKFYDSIKWDVSKYNYLKNGDKITVRSYYDTWLQGKLNINVQNEKTIIVVDGLQSLNDSVVNGIVLPSGNMSESEIIEYIELVENSDDNLSSDSVSGADWIKGQGSVETHLKSKVFLKEDYQNDGDITYKYCYDYGNISSQYFKVDMHFNDVGEYDGYICIFMDE